MSLYNFYRISVVNNGRNSLSTHYVKTTLNQDELEKECASEYKKGSFHIVQLSENEWWASRDTSTLPKYPLCEHCGCKTRYDLNTVYLGKRICCHCKQKHENLMEGTEKFKPIYEEFKSNGYDLNRIIQILERGKL